MNIRLLVPKEKRSEVEYIINIFSSVIGVPISFNEKSNLVLIYTNQSTDDADGKLIIKIPKNDNDFTHTEWNLHKESEDKITISFQDDIIRQSFDWLNRIEEINNQSFVEGYIKDTINIRKPWVNIYAHQFWAAIKEGAKNLKLELPQPQNWLGDKDFVVILTHDVDYIKKWSFRWRMGRLYYSFKALLQLDLTQIKKELSELWESFISPKDPFWNFDIIRDMEMNRQVRSTFFFLTEHKDFEMRRYKFDKNVKKIILRLRKLDFEIGLHGSRYSYNNLIKMKSELEKLQKIIPIVKGIRQHYLMFDVMKTWYIQEKSDFLYDSTLGYNNEIGFRCGICHPYKPYGKDIWELPLNIMDITILEKKDYSPSKAFRQSINILEEVKQYNGVGVILWHQRSFGYPDRLNLYEKLLDWVQANNGMVLKASEVIEKFSEVYKQ